MNAETPLYGLLAEFNTAQELLRSARRARRAGYTALDGYSPYPVRGLAEALGQKHTQVPFVVLAGGLVGASVGLIMQFYSMDFNYPFDVGGRPGNSWPVFIPICFEVMVLVSSLSAMLGMFLLNGLPRPHHPLFNVPRFVAASQDSFFLCIEAADPIFDAARTKQFLIELRGKDVLEAPLK